MLEDQRSKASCETLRLFFWFIDLVYRVPPLPPPQVLAVESCKVESIIFTFLDDRLTKNRMKEKSVVSFTHEQNIV